MMYKLGFITSCTGPNIPKNGPFIPQYEYTFPYTRKDLKNGKTEIHNVFLFLMCQFY